MYAFIYFIDVFAELEERQRPLRETHDHPQFAKDLLI